MSYQHLRLTRWLEPAVTDTSSRIQRLLTEASQIGWLFGDSLENGNRNGDLEEDLSDGMVVDNCDYMIASYVKDCERPLTTSVST